MKTEINRCPLHFLQAVLSAALIMYDLTASSQINIVNNGGFEGGWNNGPVGWQWTYNVGLDEGFSSAAQGGSFAQVYGTLYQDLPTAPGHQYHIEFAMAGNYAVPQQAELDVQWGNTTVGSVTWDPAGHNVNNLGWVWGEFDVVATTTFTWLTFSNPNVGTENIPDLDAVSVVAVPEPSSLSLLCLGIAAITPGLFRMRRQSPPRA
jgi:hypothetical protein